MDDSQDNPSTGWDFGAVSAFKAVFQRAANELHRQTVGRVQSSLANCGITLSDGQMNKLLKHTLKIGESFLAPIPAEELALALDIDNFEKSLAGCDVRLDSISLQGAEVWLYNFASWEGPTAQIAQLRIGHVAVAGDGYLLSGSLVLKSLKLHAGAAVWIDIVGQICAEALLDAAAEQVGGLLEDGELPGFEPGAFKARFAGVVRATLGRALEAGADLKIGSLDVVVDSVSAEGAHGKGRARLKDVSLGGQVKKGVVELSDPGGSLRIDFSGRANRQIAGCAVKVALRTRAGASLDAEMAVIEALDADVHIDGTLSGQPLAVKGQIALTGLAVKASTDGQTLLNMIVEICGAALPEAYAAASRLAPQGSTAATLQAAMGKALVAAIKTALRDFFTGSLGASLESLEVFIAKLTYGQHSAQGTLNVKDLRAEVEVSPDAKPKVTVEGEVSLHELLARSGGEQLIRILSLDVHLDDAGSGGIEAHFVLKGKGLAALADSAALKLLMKTEDPLSFKVPVNAYKVALAGIELKMPKHKLINAALERFVLENIRVSDEEHKDNWLRKTKKIDPTLKVSVGPKQVASLTGADLGEKPGEPASERVLIPKQELGSGSQGAVNLQAFINNVLQGQLDALLQ